uniref:Domain of unknown function DB domain-containing protein n=1 Tax=Plectus sambesii TaxID=2011161 RepID=A0A914VXR1_9BILA
MNHLVTVLALLAANAALSVAAKDLKGCVRVGCEHCLAAPRLARICPLKCATCTVETARNVTLLPRIHAVPTVVLTKQKPPRALRVPAFKRSRLVALKLIMPKSASVHLPNKTSTENSTTAVSVFLSNATTIVNVSLSNTTTTEPSTTPSTTPEPKLEPTSVTNSSAETELPSNATNANSTAIKQPILKSDNATVAASAIAKTSTIRLTNNATSRTAPRAKSFANVSDPISELSGSPADRKVKNETTANVTVTTNATVTENTDISNVTSSTVVYVKKESFTGHGTPKSITVGSASIDDEPKSRHESRTHKQLNQFLEELSLPPVSGGKNLTASTKPKPRRRLRPSTPPPSSYEEEEYTDELPPPDLVAPVIFSPPNTAVAPPPQPQDPVSVLFAPLRGTVFDPTNLLAAFSHAPLVAPVAATQPPTLAPSDLSEFYIDEPSDVVYVDEELPVNEKRLRVAGVGIDGNRDKDVDKPTIGSHMTIAINKAGLRPRPRPRPHVQQCPSQPGLEPCISKQEADTRFLQCCAPLGAGCLSLCTYDASFTAIQVAVITGQCAINKVATVLQCASGNQDATSCCEAKGVFEIGLEHCRPYCNPAGGLPTGGTSDNYRCLSKLRDIQYCFYASQRPRTRS